MNWSRNDGEKLCEATNGASVMTPKFTIGSAERLYIDQEYISNGHWLIKTEFIQTAPKPIQKLKAYQMGFYPNGIEDGYQSKEMPDWAAVIPKREAYTLLEEGPCGVGFRSHDDAIERYLYESEKGLPEHKLTVGIDPKYVPLYRMGRAFAKSATDPILILDGPTLNDNLVAVLMPMRN